MNAPMNPTPNPTDEPFFGSKTMILICLGIGSIMLMIVLAVAVKVLFGVDTFQLVAAGVTGVTAHTGAGVVRNVQADAPVRLAMAQPPVAVATPLAAPAAPAAAPPSGNLSAPIQQ